MLELPESYTISKQIHEALSSKIISYIEVLHTPHKFAFCAEIKRNTQIIWKDRRLLMQPIMGV